MIKTEKVLAAWRVLNTAKYSKLDDADKIKVWKISRVLQPVAEKFDADSKDAAEKLKPEGYDDKALKWNETRDKTINGIKDDLPMTPKEFVEFTYQVLNPYNKNVNDALEEFKDKEVELDFEPLSEEAFGKLMASNDWTMEQVMAVGIIN